MRKSLSISLFWCVAIAAVLTASCSTEKNAGLNRGYHNMTAHYNGYFNAREVVKESLKDFRDNYKEDYSKVLPVYLYANKDNASTLYPQMDKAIEKTSKVIHKHSMPNLERTKNKKEEWCKWIDNNWLVMGQAHFYKREFEAAIEKFDYIYKTYRSEEITYDAQLWMARCYMEMGNMAEARKILDRLEGERKDAEEEAKNANEKKSKKKPANKKKPTKGKSKSKAATDKGPAKYPEYLNRDLAATQADYFIRKKDYDKAIEKLELAIKLTKKKREKARFVFILAQIYQQQGNYALASETFKKIPKLNPTFEMEFYSRIYRALIYQGGDSKGIRAELMKLLRDDKNKEYFDQIYYALAELEIKDNNKQKGIELLEKSIAASINNDVQKGRSYLRLADLAFKDRDYVPSKNYYDSSLVFLPKDFQNYDEIRLKSESLTELVQHISNYKLQDSLLHLGSMSSKKREEVIDKIIQKEKEDAERKKAAELARLEAQAQNSSGGGANTEGGWYFYNAQAKAFGLTEFKKTFGVRKNEDDWRRSNKTSVSESEIQPENPDSLANQLAAKDSKRKEELLSKIPSGPEAFSECKKKIQESLYKSGVIFKDRLNQNDLAINNFKEVLKRFEVGEYVLPSIYQLYLLYTGKPEAETYKNMILTDYPDSEYAPLLRDPNAKRDDQLKKIQEEKEYLQALALYREKNYEGTLAACNAVLDKNEPNHYKSRYSYLRAMSYGELKQMEAFEQALVECSEKYASEEIGKQAAAILDLLRNKKSIENNQLGGGYVYEANTEHFFILVFNGSMGSITDAKAAFSDFNTTYFSSKGYKISNNFLDADNQLLLVKSFENKTVAMDYYRAIQNENDKLKKYKAGSYFLINNKNYAAFFLDKKVETYMKFFSENYLK